MKCKTCKHYTRYGEMCEETLDIIEPGEADCWGYEQATNADRIRRMTDKELAEFIDRCEAAGYNDSSIARDKNDQLMNVLDWLQQPAEEETQ